MRTSVTLDLYELFALLLVAAVAVTILVAAVADSFLVRLLRRMPRRSRPVPRTTVPPDGPHEGRTAPPVRRIPVPR